MAGATAVALGLVVAPVASAEELPTPSPSPDQTSASAQQQGQAGGQSWQDAGSTAGANTSTAPQPTQAAARDSRSKKRGSVPNQAPVAKADSIRIKAGATVRVDVRANDSDPNGDAIKLRRAVSVSHTKKASAQVRRGRIEVTAKPSAAGTVRVRYTVADKVKATSQGTLVVRIAAQKPIAKADRAKVTAGKRVTVPVLRNDSDPNGRKVRFQKVLNTKYGKLGGKRGGKITFTPNKDVSGKVVVRYRIRNSAGASAIGRVVVNVKPAPTTPINVERNLAKLGLPVGAVDGHYGDETRRAICAWRDISGSTPHRGLPSASEAAAIANARGLPRAHSGMVNGMNISKTCQAGFWVESGRYKRVVPATTGMAGKETRNGNWRIFRSISSTWEESNLYPGAMMYRSMYFSGGQAIHGSVTDSLVGPRPASSGCVRMLHRDVDALRSAGFASGGAVRVYGQWRG